MPKRKPTSAPTHVPAPSTPALNLSDEDRLLFEREFADVRPLPGGPGRVVPDFDATDRAREDTPGKQPNPAGKPKLHIERQGAEVSGTSYGVSRQTLRQLRKGEIPVEVTCDLHGLRADSARHRILRFVEDSARANRRAVAVIYGRGSHSGPEGSILREVVIDALSTQHHHVLAFTSAAPAQGGAGALLLLLRRKS